MSDVVIIIPLTPIPEFPSLAYRALGTYNSMAYTWAKHIREVFAPQLSVMATATQQNAELVAASIVDAAQAVTDATAQADLAMGYRNTANAAAMTATTQAGIATGAAGTATTQAGLSDTARIASQAARDVAIGARNVALGASDDAAQAALASQGFRDQAEIFATQQLVGTSSSSVTPGAGPKNFVIEPGRAFVPGMYLKITSTGTLTDFVSGTLSSYNVATGALQIASDKFFGGTARTDWAVGVAIQNTDSGLAAQRISVDTLGIANVNYKIAAAGIKLTLPVLSAGQKVSVTEEIGDGLTYLLDFGTQKLRTKAPGLVTVVANFSRADWGYDDATGGLE